MNFHEEEVAANCVCGRSVFFFPLPRTYFLAASEVHDSACFRVAKRLLIRQVIDSMNEYVCEHSVSWRVIGSFLEIEVSEPWKIDFI